MLKGDLDGLNQLFLQKKAQRPELGSFGLDLGAYVLIS
jgi:hypothetical protein